MMIDPRVSQGVAVLAAGMVAVASWQWGYRPAVQAYWQDRRHVETLETQLARVDAMIQAGGGTETWRTHNLKRLATLQSRFPQSTQLPQLLNALVDAIKVGEVKLLDVSQGTLEPVQDGGTPAFIDGQPCYRLPVTIAGEGRYASFVQALEHLTAETFPGIVSIDQAEFQLKDPLGAQLAATLRIHLYMLGTPSEPPPDA